MPVVTITGLVGSGAPEIGAQVARQLECDYVDRQVLAEAARKIGTTMDVVTELTERLPSLGDRIGTFFRRVLERSAIAGTEGGPYFGAGAGALLVREYRELTDAVIEGSEDVSDAYLLEVTQSVITDLAQSGHTVIIGRGSNTILKDWPGTLHVGLHASLESRVKRVITRERLDQAAAERYVSDMDHGYVAYFHRFFHTEIHEPLSYHLQLNTDWVDDATAAGLIVTSAKNLDSATAATS